MSNGDARTNAAVLCFFNLGGSYLTNNSLTKYCPCSCFHPFVGTRFLSGVNDTCTDFSKLDHIGHSGQRSFLFQKIWKDTE